jgi:hypothetical protein
MQMYKYDGIYAMYLMLLALLDPDLEIPPLSHAKDLF